MPSVPADLDRYSLDNYLDLANSGRAVWRVLALPRRVLFFPTRLCWKSHPVPRVKTMTRKRLRRRTLTFPERVCQRKHPSHEQGECGTRPGYIVNRFLFMRNLVWESKRTEMESRSRTGYEFHMMVLHEVERLRQGYGTCLWVWFMYYLGREFDMIPSQFFMITRSIRR